MLSVTCNTPKQGLPSQSLPIRFGYPYVNRLTSVTDNLNMATTNPGPPRTDALSDSKISIIPLINLILKHALQVLRFTTQTEIQAKFTTNIKEARGQNIHQASYNGLAIQFQLIRSLHAQFGQTGKVALEQSD